MLSKVLKPYLKSITSARILDLGCGTGFNYLALHPLGKVWSVDINERALASCKKKEIPRLYKGDAQNLSRFSDCSFDAVVAIELLEHLEKDIDCIREVHRILRPGGIFLATVPAHPFLWSSDDDLAHHFRRYTKKQLTTLLSSPFRIRFLSYRYVFLSIPAMAVFLMQKLLRFSGGGHKNSLTFTPMFANGLLKYLMSIENALLAKGCFLPFGISLICISQKRLHHASR